MQRTTRPSSPPTRRRGRRATRGTPSAGRVAAGARRYRLGRLQRLVLTALAEAEKQQTPTPLKELSHQVAAVRGHTRRPDRKKVHKNTFYRAVQGLCEKGYVRRGAGARGLRLLARGRKVIEERALNWEEEKKSARRIERRLLRRQARWREQGRTAAGRR